MVVAPLPASAVLGVRPVVGSMVGAACALMVNKTEFETPPAPFETLIKALPAVAKFAAGMMADNCVALMNVVVNATAPPPVLN